MPWIGMRSFGQSISAVSAAPKQAFAKLDKLANWDASKGEVLIQQVGRELIPDIRRELGISFDRSGIKSRTGTLRRACVENALIEIGKTGILGKLLDLMLGQTAYTGVATVYLALFTVAPSDSGGGTECTGVRCQGAGRQSVRYIAHSEI